MTTTTASKTLGQLFVEAGEPEVKAVERGSSVVWGLTEATQLKALRQSRRLAQAEVASAVGMSRRRYSNVEWVPSPKAKMQDNPTKPTQAELDRIVKFFSK